MIKYALPAAVAALALVPPVVARAQIAQPMPLTNPTNPVMSNTSTATTATTPPRAEIDAAYGFNQGASQFGEPAMQGPDLTPMAVLPVPPGAVWIPGHYDWDAASQNYVWLQGQFVLPPHPNAQWVAGHWQETPTSWIWIDGRWI
jgi:hypothetical protein